MAADIPNLPELFYLALEQELDAHPAGMREHALIRALRDRGFFDFLAAPPAPPDALFRAHFLLFHALYRLRDRWAASQQGLLQIEPLCIRRHPWSAGDAALEPGDPLRTYYLDGSNLTGMGPGDAQRLIDQFWERLARFDRRSAALAELGLQDPVDDDTVKQTWRRLAMQHHPDRGGDTARLQAINAAVAVLIEK